jgi:hypothetical protein
MSAWKNISPWLPKFMIKNIPEEVWEGAKARAIAESHDGNPRMNAVLIHLLRGYVAHGLPELPPDTETR